LTYEKAAGLEAADTVSTQASQRSVIPAPGAGVHSPNGALPWPVRC